MFVPYALDYWEIPDWMLSPRNTFLFSGGELGLLWSGSNSLGLTHRAASDLLPANVQRFWLCDSRTLVFGGGR